MLGVVTEDEAKKGRVPGLERVIAKAKGVEFSNLVHQLSVTFANAPFSTKPHETKLLKINSDAKERFPKRGGRKKVEPPKEEPKPVKAAEKPKSEKRDQETQGCRKSLRRK